jgi:hypothetical protein
MSDAISASVALKRPDRNLGGIIASKASSFTDGSARVYLRGLNRAVPKECADLL